MHFIEIDQYQLVCQSLDKTEQTCLNEEHFRFCSTEAFLNHTPCNVAAIAQSVGRRVCDRTAADSQFDSRASNASLCPWKDILPLLSIVAEQSFRCGGPV